MNFRKGYTYISQFDETCELNPLVYSDHVEVMLQTRYGIISSWNISNPGHHHYFNTSPKSTLAKTHMCGGKDFLNTKIYDQIQYIVSQLDRIPIQIIVEGYHTFFDKLKLELGNLNYALIYDENNEDPQNTIGILVNLDKFDLIDSFIYTETYIEEGDIITKRLTEKRINVAVIPIVYLKTYDNKIIVVGGSHVRGSNSRYPISGISVYNSIIEDLITKSDNNTAGIVFMGDWNSIPSNTSKIMTTSKLLITDYPTHTNPNNRASFYDQTYVVGLPEAKLLPSSELSIYSQALVESIYRSRNKYISDNEAPGE